jgi:hypothetical protein
MGGNSRSGIAPTSQQRLPMPKGPQFTWMCSLGLEQTDPLRVAGVENPARDSRVRSNDCATFDQLWTLRAISSPKRPQFALRRAGCGMPDEPCNC